VPTALSVGVVLADGISLPSADDRFLQPNVEIRGVVTVDPPGNPPPLYMRNSVLLI